MPSINNKSFNPLEANSNDFLNKERHSILKGYRNFASGVGIMS